VCRQRGQWQTNEPQPSCMQHEIPCLLL
jgi:hypothetical protein